MYAQVLPSSSAKDDHGLSRRTTTSEKYTGPAGVARLGRDEGGQQFRGGFGTVGPPDVRKPAHPAHVDPPGVELAQALLPRHPVDELDRDPEVLPHETCDARAERLGNGRLARCEAKRVRTRSSPGSAPG